MGTDRTEGVKAITPAHRPQPVGGQRNVHQVGRERVRRENRAHTADVQATRREAKWEQNASKSRKVLDEPVLAEPPSNHRRQA